MPPKGGVSFYPYFANNRDAIYQNQEKFKIKIKRLPGDIWLKEVFGIDLPFSIWAQYYNEKPSFDMDRILGYSYYQAIKARDAVFRPSRLANNNWNKAKRTLRERAAYFYRSLQFFAWESIHYSLQIIGKGNVFRLRTKLFLYFSRVMDAANAIKANSEETLKSRFNQNARVMSTKQYEQPSFFSLRDDCLYKDYAAPGAREKWSLSLNSDERKVIRYLYWSRKRKDVIQKFENENSEPEITEIIECHIKLGSLIQFRNLLLCVVNDPGYWKETQKFQ
jgi:hypothetical protein